MTIEFTEEQEMFRESVREFGERKIAPVAIEMEETKEIPLDIIKGILPFSYCMGFSASSIKTFIDLPTMS